MSGASRYETILKLASGGMATVYVGNVRGALGFRQLVAIKKPHPHLLSDPGFRDELVAEARLASMIHHANVVDVRDVEIDGESISLVMDYIEGATLGDLIVAASRKGQRIPARAVIRIMLDAAAGLHAAHELVDERGRPVGLVHRDVSPQNILVGADGISRVADFGVAKFARKNMQSTSEGSLKGKLAYMAPEYVRAEGIDRRFDVYAIGIVLWEALSGKRLFRGENEAETLHRLLEHVPEPVSKFAPELAPIDAVVACALAKNREERFNNAQALGAALEGSALSAGLLAGHSEVARAVKDLVGPAIEERRTLVRAKQANEPSVASLMGAPPIVLPPNPTNPPKTEGPATTIVDVPEAAAVPTMTSPAAAATPKQGGGMTLAAESAVPTTQPMTPAMMAPVPAPMDSPRTLASPHSPMIANVATAISPPFAAPAPAPAPAPAIANSTLRSTDPAAETEAVDIPGVSSSGSRSWVLPVVIGVLVLGGAGVAFAMFGGMKKQEAVETTQASSALSSSAPVVATTPTTPTTTASTASTSIAVAATTSAPPATKTTARPATTTKPVASPTISAAPPPPVPTPAPTPTPEPTPTSTQKKPPPNPYGNN